jgi:flagellar P-ring protein precursor FlgI
MAHGKLNVTVGGVKKNLMDLPANTTLTDLVSALNALNVNSDDMTAIFESLKASGALHADLIVR